MPQTSPIRVTVTRGDLVESIHEVAACAVDATGGIVRSHGDVERPVFVRSAAKPFIAATIVLSGAAERFGFDDRELATISASHNGEPFHVAVVEGILAKIGLTVADLQCGAIAGPCDERAFKGCHRAAPARGIIARRRDNSVLP